MHCLYLRCTDSLDVVCHGMFLVYLCCSITPTNEHGNLESLNAQLAERGETTQTHHHVFFQVWSESSMTVRIGHDAWASDGC